MILSRLNLKKINAEGLAMPDEKIFALPEKVLQFGTGVLLRGLPDYFIDKANRNGIFNGRVVVVKSTGTGSASAFDEQDSLYTIYIKGVESSKEINEQVVCSAISRVLSAVNDWSAILETARSPDLQIVISNTTEVGIQLVDENVHQQPPGSFPGKLLAVLYERYKAFNGSESSGLVIIPTELIVDNGKKLEAIVLELAHLNKLEPLFFEWLQNSNFFCNSLVDRIVPGKPSKALGAELDEKRGYTDDLHIIAEPYSLWAIEGNDKVASVLSFSQADKGMVVTSNIELFRELKLRLLNGSHTLSCALAFISGFNTVKEAMDDEKFSKFITKLLFEELIPSIPYPVAYNVAADFVNKVLDRFRNQHIHHEWLSISVQYSAKIKLRVIPLLLNYYKLNNMAPTCMALGFAAFIRFMKVKSTGNGTYTGSIGKREYIVTDSHAGYFCKVWESENVNSVVEAILQNEDLWGTDLSVLPGFKEAIILNLNRLITN